MFASSSIRFQKIVLKKQKKFQIHWGLGIRAITATKTLLHDSLNVRILSVQYRYRDPLLYGYQDSLGIGITCSTCMVTEAPSLVQIPKPLLLPRPIRIPRPPLYYRGGLGIGTTDIETPVYLCFRAFFSILYLLCHRSLFYSLYIAKSIIWH